jgi:serine/threonine protein kinase
VLCFVYRGERIEKILPTDRQIVTTIIACHRHSVVHRDLKEDNLLVDLKTRKLSLIDFGAFIKEEEQAFTDFDGMRMYVPKERICCARYQARPATFWSLGILLFDMVQGEIPFEKDKEICSAELRYRKASSVDWISTSDSFI